MGLDNISLRYENKNFKKKNNGYFRRHPKWFLAMEKNFEYIQTLQIWTVEGP